VGVWSARQARAGEAREGWWEAPLASWSDRDVELLEIWLGVTEIDVMVAGESVSV
jgi:hypothetical protein